MDQTSYVGKPKVGGRLVIERGEKQGKCKAEKVFQKKNQVQVSEALGLVKWPGQPVPGRIDRHS